MALANMYKVNNVSYYGSGHGMSGIFSDTIENLTANGMIDYSIFLNTGSTWAMKNTGTIGNHFAWYADWVGGVLAVRKGPDVIGINYLGSAILSKNTGCTVANLSAKQADGAGWNDFKNARFMVDAINSTQGNAAQYVPFNYAEYTGQKYGFNSCFIQSTAGYATSNTSYSYTQINDYTTLTGDNAKRIVYSNYIVMLTAYNPYLTDNSDIDKQDIGYIWDFFDIGGEIVCVRDILRMPNSAHWQSWSYYHDVTDKYVTIGGFGDNITAGSQGALPLSDDVKGIFSYNHNGTSANWFVTKNAVDFKTNSMGLRWCVGNTTISTAKQWRDNVRLGVMSATGVITHNQWIIGEIAIQASDNPNKNTDYDHIPTHGGGGGGGNGDELLDMESRAQFYGSGVTTYYVNVPTAKLKTALGNWDNVATGKDVLKNLISYKLFCFPTSTFTNGMLHDFVIAGTTLKDESDNPIQSAQLTQYGAVSLPSITIPKTFNDFRDYAPYTNLSMYIPLCGWFTLPPWCMGRTISGEMYINGYTGTLKCIVRADGNVVTELGGNASIDLPFAAEAVGMKAAAVLGNLINTAGSIASIANPSAGGAANVGTAVLGTVCALNANYTESKGTMGDGSNIAGLYHVYIKISRPATIDNEGNSLVAIPTEYKHQYGLPCNKSLTLTQGDGYTQILDANITGNMTAREKQMIIDGFRRGLIL